MFAALGRIPVRGEVIASDDLPGWEVEVARRRPRRIKTVRLVARPTEPAEPVEAIDTGL